MVYKDPRGNPIVHQKYMSDYVRFYTDERRTVAGHSFSDIHYSAALFERWTFFARQFETDG